MHYRNLILFEEITFSTQTKECFELLMFTGVKIRIQNKSQDQGRISIEHVAQGLFLNILRNHFPFHSQSTFFFPSASSSLCQLDISMQVF
jgi:hypothetical protein